MIIQANETHIPELQIYAATHESAIKHIREPELGLFIAETPDIILRAMAAGYVAESILIDTRFMPDENQRVATIQGQEQIQRILRQAGDVPVYVVTAEMMTMINGFKQARGVLCAMRRRKLPAFEDVLKTATRLVVMEDVENPTNAGAIFRSAAALGFDGAILTHGSTDPLYRRSARVSMGGVFRIPWTFAGNKYERWEKQGLPALKAAGFVTAAMALSDRAYSMGDPALEPLKHAEKMAILLGNEENGLTQETVDTCDYVIKIPMQMEMDSLNVAAASAVAFWEYRKQ